MSAQFLVSKVVVLAMTALMLAGCHKTEEPQIDSPSLSTDQSMQDVEFYSAALKREMKYRVFLPDTVVPGARLPWSISCMGEAGIFATGPIYSNVSRLVERNVFLSCRRATPPIT
jgi:predicted peptidase